MTAHPRTRGALALALSLASVLGAACCAACDIASTREQAATRDLNLYVTLDSTNAGTHVAAQLVGPFGPFGLAPDDSFVLAIDGAPIASAAGPAQLALDVPNRSGAFAFALHHAGDHDVTSTVPLPGPSALAAVAIPGGGGQVTATWTPGAPPDVVTTLAVSGDCVETLTIPIVTDTGSYAVAGALLQSSPAPCTLTVALARTLDVQTQPFSPGDTFMFAKANQTESVQVAWTP